MRGNTRRLRRAATIVMAAGSLATLLSSSAYASAGTVSCSATASDRGVYVDACWFTSSGSEGVQYRADAVTYLGGGFDQAKWDLCEVRIGLNVRPPGSSSFSRRATTYYSGANGCLAQFKSMSSNGVAYDWAGTYFVPQTGYCYQTVVRVLGIYNGSAYDTGGAYGSTYCGHNSTPGLGDGVLDAGVGDVPGIVSIPEIG